MTHKIISTQTTPTFSNLQSHSLNKKSSEPQKESLLSTTVKKLKKLMSSLSPSKRKKIKDESKRTKNTSNSASLISEELSPDEKEKRIVQAGTKVQETMRALTNQTTAEDSDEDE